MQKKQAVAHQQSKLLKQRIKGEFYKLVMKRNKVQTTSNTRVCQSGISLFCCPTISYSKQNEPFLIITKLNYMKLQLIAEPKTQNSMELYHILGNLSYQKFFTLQTKQAKISQINTIIKHSKNILLQIDYYSFILQTCHKCGQNRSKRKLPISFESSLEFLC